MHKLHTQTILVGDFNTGLDLDTTGEEFACPEYMQELVHMGWVDTWRYRHADKRECTTTLVQYAPGLRLSVANACP